MKISQELRSQLDIAKKNPIKQPGDSDKFNQLVSLQSKKLKDQEIQKLIQSITLQGDRLANHRSFKDLTKYKYMIKEFINDVINNGLDVKHSNSWNMQGNNRTMMTIETIDSKLVELTDLVLDQEKKSIGLLDIVGEIKGLLINLYM